MAEPFTIVHPGTGSDATPVTPKNVPTTGGPVSPAAGAIQARFPGAVVRVAVSRGETAVTLEIGRAHV